MPQGLKRLLPHEQLRAVICWTVLNSKGRALHQSFSSHYQLLIFLTFAYYPTTVG